MNRAEKGWMTRYTNEIAILQQKLEELRQDLYNTFIEFVNKTGKYQDMTRELKAMQTELERFQRKHKGGSSLEEDYTGVRR